MAHYHRLARGAALAPALLLAAALPARCQNPSYSVRALAGVKAHVITVKLGPEVKVTLATAEGSARYCAESFGSMVARTAPTAAINGAAFCTETLKPIGDLVADGHLLSAGLMGTALCLRADGRACIRRVTWGHAEDWSAYETVLGCGPTLVRGGAVDLDPAGERFRDPHLLGAGSHSACGLGAQGRLYLVSVSPAASLPQMAQAMLALGCSDAMLLDGGASLAMYYRGRTIVSPGRPLTNLLLVYGDRAGAPRPPTAQEYYASGLGCKRRGETETAIRQLERALALQADHREAHWALAWLLAQAGRPQEAAAEFRRVLQLAPAENQKREAEAALARLAPPLATP